MTTLSRFSLWRLMRSVNRWVLSRYPPQAGRLVLLLTTVGRKSGLPRSTPLQYEEIDGAFYVAAARGQHADWFRNIVAQPCVEVQVGGDHFAGLAEPITDPQRIADFLELRRQRHPVMIGAMLLMHGLPPWAGRVSLERLAAQLALVALQAKK